MRRLSMIAIVIILALVFVGYSSSNDPNEKAEEFLNMYYDQYEKKDKIKEIANQSNWGMQIQERICLLLQPRSG